MYKAHEPGFAPRCALTSTPASYPASLGGIQSMPSHVRNITSALIVLAALSPLAHPQSLPTTWVDKDTGHRVYRLTDEPGSSAFYFNVNDYTPDGKELIYTAPDGIHECTATASRSA
jgi:hypothetical protein